MPHTLLNIEDLTVDYRPRSGKAVRAVDRVSLQLDAGEIVAILGESGSGKSTLASSILQLLPRDAEHSGSIFFQRDDVTRMDERRLLEIRGRYISMVPQDPATSLNPVMRVGMQVSEVLRAHLPMNRSVRTARVLELFREVGFDNPERIAASYPHQLSGGQRQRVVIAQAIACQPELIIADEPTSKLDGPLQIQILELISKIVRQHGTALLWITHDPGSLLGFADRVVVMHRGRVVESGETQDVLRRPTASYTQTLMQLARDLALATPQTARHHVQ